MFSLVMFAMFAACGDKEESDTAVASVDVSFALVRDEILLQSCAFSSCHGGVAGGLVLDEQGAHEALVNVEATTGDILVIPGDPGGSYLIQKMENSDGIMGTQMPPSGLLDAEKIAWVRAWIAAGALND